MRRLLPIIAALTLPTWVLSVALPGVAAAAGGKGVACTTVSGGGSSRSGAPVFSLQGCSDTANTGGSGGWHFVAEGKGGDGVIRWNGTGTTTIDDEDLSTTNATTICPDGDEYQYVSGVVAGGTGAAAKSVETGWTLQATLCIGSSNYYVLPGTDLTIGPLHHIKPGGVWTVMVPAGVGCEVQTFAPGYTWTADDYGDAGTYSGGNNTISEDFTAGEDAGGTFTATYSKSDKDYFGTGNFDGMSFPVTLVKGAQSGC